MRFLVSAFLAALFLLVAASVVLAASWTVAPDSDVSTGSWTIAPLWPKVDEDIDSPDSTTIISALDPATPANDINFTLTNISDNLATDVNVRVRARRLAGTRNVSLNVSWFAADGALIASMDTGNLTDTMANYASGSILVSVQKEDMNSSYLLARPNTTGIGISATIEIDAINLDITTDTTPFTIIFASPTDSNQTAERNYSYVNVTTGETPDTILLEWDGANESLSGSGTVWSKNKTGLANANYTFKVWANDSAGNMNVSETRWVLTSGVQLGPTLNTPLPGITTNVIQNSTFVANATVICSGGDCGNVNGTVRYNWSAEPDTPVNETLGDKPFFVNETPASATKDCPNNPLNSGDNCTLTWTINASGAVGMEWSMDVIFNSSVENITDNDTQNSVVSIIGCSVDLTLQWNAVSFGEVVPNTDQNAAPGNSADEYNVTVNPGSCLTDLYIKGTDLTNSTLATLVGVGNVTWSNTTDSYPESHELSKSSALIKAGIAPVANITTWYWIDLPPVFAGRYNGTITITGVENGETV